MSPELLKHYKQLVEEGKCSQADVDKLIEEVDTYNPDKAELERRAKRLIKRRKQDSKKSA